jgi:sugar phosphate isomerase/epimerase
MEIGVISYLLRHHDTHTAMGFLHDIGFEFVELDYRHVDGLCDYHSVNALGAEATRTIVESYGIIPRAYCVGGLGREHVTQFVNVFEFAKGLGVDVIVGVLDPAVLPELSEFCEKYRMYYAIENHMGNVFQAADTIIEALEGHSTYIGANADTGHFTSAGLIPVEEVRKLQGRIHHVHFKDSNQEQPLGSGTADLSAVFAELKRQGYGRMVSIEHYEYQGIDDETLRVGLTQALAYVRELVRAVQ